MRLFFTHVLGIRPDLIGWRRGGVAKLSQMWASNGIAADIISGATKYTQLEQDAIGKIEGSGFRVDYVAICNSKSLEKAAQDDSELVVLGAIFTDAARIIDNVVVTRDR